MRKTMMRRSLGLVFASIAISTVTAQQHSAALRKRTDRKRYAATRRSVQRNLEKDIDQKNREEFVFLSSWLFNNEATIAPTSRPTGIEMVTTSAKPGSASQPISIPPLTPVSIESPATGPIFGEATTPVELPTFGPMIIEPFPTPSAPSTSITFTFGPTTGLIPTRSANPALIGGPVPTQLNPTLSFVPAPAVESGSQSTYVFGPTPTPSTAAPVPTLSFPPSAPVVSNNILELIQNQSQYSTLALAASKSGLDDVLRSTSALTVFAPDNSAFEALGMDYVNLLITDSNFAIHLKNLVENHATKGAYYLKDLKNGLTLNMLNQETDEVLVSSDGTTYLRTLASQLGLANQIQVSSLVDAPATNGGK